MTGSASKSWLPTRKWLAGVVTAVSGWVIALLHVGTLTISLKILGVTIIAQALVSYLVPNLPTPGGVPLKNPGRARQRGYTVIELLVGLAVFIIVVLLLVKLIDRL